MKLLIAFLFAGNLYAYPDRLLTEEELCRRNRQALINHTLRRASARYVDRKDKRLYYQVLLYATQIECEEGCYDEVDQ